MEKFSHNSVPTGEAAHPTAAQLAQSGGLRALIPMALQLLQQAADEPPHPGSGTHSQIDEAQKHASPPAERALSGVVPAALNSAFRKLPNRGLATTPALNPLPAAHPAGAGGQALEKTVLFEACTINQPLNAQLREKYSTGTYYFLK